MEVAIDTVLAGSGDFVAAVGPTLRARSGGEPQVAADPRQAFALCARAGGLLVLQYSGQEWLGVVRDLRSLCGDAIAMVVAVAPERVEEIGSVQRAGADEVVPWDGRADAVQWAVERALAARREKAAATPVPQGYLAPAGGAAPLLQRMTPAAGMPAAAPPAASPAVPPPLPASTSPAREPVPAASPAAPAATPAPGALPWPGGVPEGPDADWLLRAAVEGVPTPPGPQREAADAVAASLSGLERGALQGAAIPVEADLVRSASVLRLRVALALASVPAPGSPVDDGAVQALLGELDAALGRLKAAAEGCPADALPGLEALRTALVREAIDLTEVVQRLGPAGAPAALPAAAPAAAARPVPRKARRPAETDFVVEVADESSGRKVLWTLLALALLAGVAFHVHRYLTRPVPPSVHVPGAPAGSVATRPAAGKPVVLVKPNGAFDAAELETLRAQEEIRGKTVRQLSPGTVLIERSRPRAGAPGAAEPPQGAKP